MNNHQTIVFRPSTLIRSGIIFLALVCLGSWYTFRAYSQSDDRAALKSESESNAPSVTSGIFLAAVEQFGVGSGSVDLFNVTLGGNGAADTFSAASPATVAVTNSTNENKPDIDNPLNALFDTSGDLLVGNGGTTTGTPQDNGSFACIPASAISTTQNSSTTISTNVDDPVGIAYDKRDGSVAFANNPTSSPVQLVEFLLNGGYSAAPSGRNLTASGYGSFSIANLPTLPAGTYAIGLTDGLETDPAHSGTGKSKIAILTPTSSTTSTETDITDTTTFAIDVPHGLAWDATNNQLVIANFSTWHRLLSFYSVSPVAQVKTINTTHRMDKVAVSPDGHVAVSWNTSFGTQQVQVYDNTAARNPVNGPIPFNGTTTSNGNTYNFPQAGVNSLTWLSNTKLLIALQSYNGSVASAQNGLYIYDISATAVPAGYDDVSGSAFAAAPKQTGFVHINNKPLGTAITTPTTFAAGTGASCGTNPSCYTTLSQAIANTPAGGILNVLGGTFNESVTLNNNIIMNLDADTTVNDFTISAGATLNGGGGFCAQANGATLTLKNNWSNGGTFNAGGGTVAFSGSAAQTISGNQTTFNNLTVNNTSGGVNLGNNETVNGSLTLTNGALGVGTNTLTLNGAASKTNGSLTSSATGTVNYNQGSDGQSVLAANYGNLTFSNFKKTLPNGGTVGIAGTFAPGTATGHTVTGSTIEFNGTSAQTLPSGFTTYNNLTLNNSAGTTGFSGLTVQGLIEVKAGTFTGNNTTAKDVQIDGSATLAGTNATTISVSGNWTNNGTFTSNGNTVNFNGSALQTIGGGSATTFNNLTVNNVAGASLGNSQTIGGTLTLTSGTLGVASNTLTLNGAVAFTGGVFSSNSNGTVNYNQGSNGQAIAPGQYGNLTFSNFTKTLPNGSSVKIAGVFTTGAAGSHTVTGSTVEFNGTSAQTLPSGFTTYNNLTLNNTAGATGFSGLTVQNLIRVQAGSFTSNNGTFNNVQIDASTTLAGTNATTINVSGNWTNNGTFTANGNTINFNGSALQTIGGSSTSTFNNLTLGNTSGVNLGVNAVVSGTLLINPSVLLNLGLFDVTAVGTLTNNGTIRKTQSVAGTGAKTFGLAGRLNGANLTVNVATQGTLSSLQVDRIDANHPNAATPEQTGRYWIITPTGTGYSVNLTLPRDNANAPSACRYTGTGTNWDCDLASSTANSVTRNSVTSLSASAPWAVGDNAIIAPTIAKAFSATTIQTGGQSTVTLTLSNSNINSLISGAFTDTLTNMTAVGGAVGGTCVGTSPSSLSAGATNLSFSGITIPANSNCTVTFAITSSSTGSLTNTTSGVTTLQTPTAGTASNTANLTVAAPPSISKAFSPTTIQPGGQSTVTLTLTNSNTTGALTNGSFTDTLTNMSAVAGAVGGTCTGTSPTTLSAGVTALSFTGITIPTNGSCTVTFSVTSNTVGVKPNTTSGVTTTQTPTAGTASNTANLTVIAPPSISKSFAPSAIALNGISTLTITITNPSANNVALTGVGVTDAFPAGMEVDATPSITNSCSSGTFAPTATATSISISGATIPVNTACTFTVNVKGTTLGAKANTTGAVTSANGGTGTTASATLTVESLEGDVSTRPNGDASIQSNDVVQMLRFLNEIDVPSTVTDEFQRADSAPRAQKGNGVIDSADVIQTIRYLNELDALQTVGGPNVPAPAAPPNSIYSIDSKVNVFDNVITKQMTEPSEVITKEMTEAPAGVITPTTPALRVESTNGYTGNQVTVNIRVDAVGNESQYGFALLFDPSVLTYTNFAAGNTGSAAGSFSCNTTSTAGRIRCSVGSFPNNEAGTNPAITEIDPGTNKILIKVIFTVAAGATPGTMPTLNFASVSASDENANSITEATTNGTVTVLAPTASAVSVSGRVTADGRRGISGATVHITKQNGDILTTRTNPFGYYSFNGLLPGETLIFNVYSKRYQFDTQVVTLTEDLQELNFTPTPSPGKGNEELKQPEISVKEEIKNP